MKKLKIVVCVKQIPDPEAPLGSAKIDSENNRMDVSLLRQVINPFDENALEAALRLKDEVGGEVTVLNVGLQIGCFGPEKGPRRRRRQINPFG